MDFANYPNYDSWLSVTNSFVKKFSNLILLSRIKNEKETRKMNKEVIKISTDLYYTYIIL